MATIDRMPRRRSIALVALLSLAACSPAPSAIPTSPSSAPSSTIATDEPASTTSPTFSLPTQTDTAWGRIWDELPKWFPMPAGASPTETGEGPFTAELALPAGSAANSAAEFFQSGLEVSFTPVNVDGPLEDGSFVVSVVGVCQVEVRVRPLGAQVVAQILYGAGCPFLMR